MFAASTPIDIKCLAEHLESHPDCQFVHYLCYGLQHGFDTMVSQTHTELPTRTCKNLLSARTQPSDVNRLLQMECDNGYMLGPFENLGFDKYVINPIGIAEGRYSRKKRLIVDLSSPHSGPNPSINDLIDKEQCSLSYVRIDDAIKAIQQYGQGAILCKFDIKDAFKLLPIHPSQWHLFCVKWNNQCYIPVRLCFGARSSPRIFDQLAQALCWIAKHKYEVETIFHLLDDFLTVQNPTACGERNMALLCTMFKRLNIPLALAKLVGPTTILEYLGVILDSEKMQARLPMDKVHRICQFIQVLLTGKHCTKRTLLQIIGHFQFASKVVLAGRSFFSYLIKLSTTVRELHHYVHINNECREDLKMWHIFLTHWNGVSVFHDSFYTASSHMHLFTDAASTFGFGGCYQKEWFSSAWPQDLPVMADNKLSMAFMELYPIVVSCILWGKTWQGKKIQFMCDNIATVCIINKGRSKCITIMKLMRQLTWCAAIHNFAFSATYISTHDNHIGDSLSRFQISKFRRLLPDANPDPQECPPPSAVMWNSATCCTDFGIVQ